MKKIEMPFYKTMPSEKNAGMKMVLWEVTTNEGKNVHDWGFCEWDGTAWGDIEMPEGYSAIVVWWANTVNPELLLKEESKIISLR